MIITGRPARLNHKLSFDECVRFFKKVGFDGIEFCFEDYFFHVRPDYLEDYFIKHAVELCGELGMTIASVGNHLEYVWDDDMFNFIKRTIPKVRDYGTDILITATPDFVTNYKFLKRDEYYKRFTTRLAELLSIGQHHGVKIAIEPELNNLICSTDDFLNLCDEMGKDNLVCNLDIGHTFLTDLDVYDSVRRLGDKIVHSHVEGMNRGEHVHLLPGDGDMDLAKCIATMAEVGFDGALALDLYIHDYAEVAEQSVKTLREMIKRI